MMESVKGYSSDALRMAALAHDLRTPMCVAAGAAQMALEAGGQDVSCHLEQILQAVSAMERLLSDAQAGEKKHVFTADMLYQELAVMTRGQAAYKHQLLSIDLSAIGDMRMETDYDALCRILINLLGNAVKYTPPGGVITLRTQIERRILHAGSARLRFIIADNGQGMTRQFMSRMYQPFARAKETAAQPGRGLGLAIVRRMVRRMGGSIRVRSEWGKGSVFTVWVPVRIVLEK